MLSEFLTSETRAEVLRALFNGEGKEYYFRELKRASSSSISSLQREVDRLCELELVKKRKDGNRVYFMANIEHPIYPELVSIVGKTVGIWASLKRRLKNSKIDLAFVFGSFAQNSEGARSDIDLCVVGDISMRGLSKLLSGLQEEFAREINPHIFTKSEFQKRIKENDHFVTSILKGSIKLLEGNIDEYK